jgi:hypothetical protein
MAKKARKPGVVEFVLDGSLALAWYFKDEADPDADAVAARFPAVRAAVPLIWPLEVANAVLMDLYGKQRLLYEHHLPPVLVFGNPQFLRPCFGIIPPDGVHLHTYAADLARSPGGRW